MNWEHWIEAEHMPIHSRWVRARGLATSDYINVLPPTGFVVGGIVMGFLYCTNSPLAIMDGFISDPECDKASRRKALSILVPLLIKLAKELGFHAIAASPSLGSLVELGKENGLFPVSSCTYILGKLV